MKKSFFNILLVGSAICYGRPRPMDPATKYEGRLCPTMQSPINNCTLGNYRITYATPDQIYNACLLIGMNLVNITLDNSQSAIGALRRCGVVWAVVQDGSAGANGDTVLTEDGVLVTNTMKDYCGRMKIPVLCQSPSSTSLPMTSTSTTTSMTETPKIICPNSACGDGDFLIGSNNNFNNASCPIGYEMAMVNITNIQQASQVLKNCSVNAAWVDGWNGDNYQNNTCLVLTFGPPGIGNIGTVVPLANCSEIIPPLCSKKVANMNNSNSDNNLGNNSTCQLDDEWILIKQKVNYEYADEACNCFGNYALANITGPIRLPKIQQCIDEHGCDDIGYHMNGTLVLWVNDLYNRGKCAAMITLPGLRNSWLFPSYGMTDATCAIKGYPLCSKLEETSTMTSPCPTYTSYQTSSPCPSYSYSSVMESSYETSVPTIIIDTTSPCSSVSISSNSDDLLTTYITNSMDTSTIVSDQDVYNYNNGGDNINTGYYDDDETDLDY